MPIKKGKKLVGYIVVNLGHRYVGQTCYKGNVAGVVCDEDAVVFDSYSQAKVVRDGARKDNDNPNIYVFAVREIPKQ